MRILDVYGLPLHTYRAMRAGVMKKAIELRGQEWNYFPRNVLEKES